MWQKLNLELSFKSFKLFKSFKSFTLKKYSYLEKIDYFSDWFIYLYNYILINL